MKRLMLIAILVASGCEGTVRFDLDGSVDGPDDVVVDTADDTGLDTDFDTTPDVGYDTAFDTTPDEGFDTAFDTGLDTAFDTATDTGPDVGFDTAVDTSLDTASDVVPDGYVCITTSDCMMGLECCSGRCVNLLHDPDHCSACGTACPDARPFCAGGSCVETPCFGVTCIGTETCCGNNCCAIGAICCEVDGPGPTGGPDCYVGVCPGGCPLCG
jgi:hypothetical protein